MIDFILISSMPLFYLIICTDIVNRQIPNTLTGLLAILGVSLNTYLYGYSGLYNSILAGFIGLFLFTIMGCINILLCNRPRIGGGDVKLLAAIGTLFGPFYTISTFAICPFLVVIWGLIFKSRTVPLAPFIYISLLTAIIFTGGQYGN